MTKQYGIIYKFTIVAKLKMDGQRPFYVGQHITTLNPEEFLSRDYYYYGSGSRSEETKQKLSESHIGLQAGQNHPMYGKHHSEETRRMLSEKLRGRKLSEKELERRTGYRWINNGETSIQFKGDILPQGYKYGRIKWKK